MILSTWLDRPLSVAGRLAVKNGNGIEGRLVNIDRDLCVIPNVAIHMNREMNKGVEYNPQVDLLPLLADVSLTNMMHILHTMHRPHRRMRRNSRKQ